MEHNERVTDPVPARKDPKRVAAGRAAAAIRKAKQERLLEELREVKKSYCPAASIPLKDSPNVNISPESHDCKERTNWTPWIIGLVLRMVHTYFFETIPRYARLTLRLSFQWINN